jgi:hypothetical protein
MAADRAIREKKVAIETASRAPTAAFARPTPQRDSSDGEYI